MKRLILVAVFICCLILSGCGRAPQAKNTIQTKALSADQQEIVDLLTTTNQEILLFSYATDESYKSYDFWVEVYKDGELIEPRASGISGYNDDAKPLSGELAIIISQTPDFQWSFVLDQDGARISSSGEPSPHHDTMARAYAPITSPQTIEDGKEIILYISAFSDGSIRVVSPEDYNENSQLLENHPYVHIIKCRFSSDIL